MKIAFYIEDGLEQIVLTPESTYETGMLDKLHDNQRTVEILKGAFYECHGGWVRHNTSNTSTMLVLRRRKTEA